MSWDGELVIDLDSHIVERADRFYEAYIDPAFRDVDSQQVRFGTGENTVSPRSGVRGGEADGKGTGLTQRSSEGEGHSCCVSSNAID